MLKYVLFNTRTGAYRLSGGYPREWNYKDEAEHYRTNPLFITSPSQWEVRAWDASPWRNAVRQAYVDGTRVPTVWHSERFHLARMEELAHYPCVGMGDPSMIDFYPSLEKAQKGQSQSMKPGKYLRTFYGDILSDTDVKAWSDKHKENHGTTRELKWAKTPDEIEAVYSMDAGFQSCMQHRRSHWGHGIHPTRAYGAGDLAIAYIERDNFLMARALVWPEKKKVGRVYGEAAMLRNALRREGIPTESSLTVYDSMEGAKMLYIPLPTRRRSDSITTPILAPYIDSRDDTYGLIPEGDEENPTALKVVKGTYARFLAVDQGGVINGTRKCLCCGVRYNANKLVVNKPGYKGEFNTHHQFQEYVCSECVGDGSKYFADAATSVLLSKEHYTPVPYYHYSYEDNDLSRRSHRKYIAKEIVANNLSYFISDFSKHAFRSHEKWVTPDGKEITVHERDEHFQMSTYNGKYYPKTEMELINGRYFTKAQKYAILASKYDLFIRNPEESRSFLSDSLANLAP